MDEDDVEDALQRVEETVNRFYGPLRKQYPEETVQQVLERAKAAIDADPVLRAQHLADLYCLVDAGIATLATLH